MNPRHNDNIWCWSIDVYLWGLIDMVNTTRSWTATTILVVAVGVFCGRSNARQPTEFEQFQLELINQARANPNAEVARLASDPRWEGVPNLNEGLASDTISSESKSPLAFNLSLIDAASDYSDTLLAQDAFGHTFGGTTPESRIISAGYPLAGPSGTGENIAVSGSTASHPISRERVEDHHNGLFIDDGVDGRGHRVNLLDEDWREIGIGIREGFDYDALSIPNLNAVLTTQNFAFTGQPGHGPYLTGVAYNDLDFDSFYTPGIGEALSGLAVDVFQVGTDTLVGSTTTYGSGGYAISVAEGVYDVLFSGMGIQQIFTGLDLTSGQSVKLDAVNPVPEPSVLMMLCGVGVVSVLVGRRRVG